MADSDFKKPLDRIRPFRRINNEEFIVKKDRAPDGNGVACGCHTPAQFGDVSKEFQEFIKGKIPFIKALTDVLETVKEIIDTIQNIALLVSAISAAITTFLSGLFPLAVPAIIPAVAASVIAITAAAKAIIKLILDGVNDALRDFFTLLGKRVMNRVIRCIPQWVPVLRGASNRRVTRDQIVEVEGICTRSFSNPIDVPFYNWHFWFNWNVQVRPEPEYENLRSVADPPNRDKFEANERPLFRDNAFEIQCDAGFLTGDVSPYINGFPADKMHLNEGAMIQGQWIWPMAGMFVWAAGRWVYDCSRVTSDADPKMCTMMNPAKAIATARSQAFSFDENQAAVPAIQFMFVTTKRGGKDPVSSAQMPYIGYDTITDTDYEFILDLPPGPSQEPVSFPIAHTGNVLMNTIVLRPKLLKDVRQLPLLGGTPIEPVIEPIRPDDPTQAPSQVRIKIPLKSIDPNAAAAGFVLSLGWFDPTLEQARKVKRCKLALDGFSGRLQIRDSPIKKLENIFKEEEDRLKKIIRDRVGNIKIIDIHIPIINKDITIHLKDIPIVGDAIDAIVSKAIEALIKGLIKLLPLEKEEWLLHVGVNGEWRSHFFDGVGSDPVQLREKNFELVRDKFIFDLQLAVGDSLSFAVHGTEFDPVGDIMHSPRSNRLLTTDNQPVPWSTIADPNIDKQLQRELVFQSVLKIMTDSTEGIGKLSLGFDNSPLGIIDPDPTARGSSPNSNPMLIKDNLSEREIRRTAAFARAVGDQMILAEDPNTPDYTISYTLEIVDLISKST